MTDSLDREYFKKLANQLMFSLTDEEADNIVKEFGTLQSQMALLDKINTDDVLPMEYPFEHETYFLREDEVSNVISQEDALKNAKDPLEGHFTLPKVVK